MQDGYHRYAIAWVPRRGTALEMFGAEWTGWSAEAGARVTVPGAFRSCQQAPGVPGVAGQLGLHASLTAPFRLARKGAIWSLDRALQDLAERTTAIRLPRLSLTVFDRQVVLAPAQPSGALTLLLADAASLLSDHGTAADRAAGPALRFFMPLTDRLALGGCYDVVEALRTSIEPIIARPHRVGDLALVGDPGGARPWRVIERYALNETAVDPGLCPAQAMACCGPHLMAPLRDTAEPGPVPLLA